MCALGQLIFRASDGEGEIHVYQDERFRYLTFGNLVEQSCLDLANPVRLEHVYTQAMLLAPLLLERPCNALILGLGGGGLARALRTADRGLRISGIDRSAAVIAAARDYFHLPDDRRFATVCADAQAFLQCSETAWDLVFADLYLAEGMHPDQVDSGFLALAHARLGSRGVLVLNQWASEFQANRAANAVLDELFGGRVLTLHVQGGNIVSFAFAGELPLLDRETLHAAALALGERLAIPLQRHARNLWRQNAEVLGVGRFRLYARD